MNTEVTQITSPSAESELAPAKPGHWWRAFLGFLGLAALFYAPLLLGLRTFPDGDFTHHFLPFSLFQQQAWLAGRLPLWNPYTYSGHPFLADTQAAVFYPLSNLLLGLTLPWTAVGERLYLLQLEAVLHVALAGFFVYLLVNALTHQHLAAFTAGCAFAFSGYLTGYPPLQLAVLRTAIWLPLLLYLLFQAMQGPRRWRWWIGAGITYAVAFLAGHPQTFLHISYTIVGWVLFLLIHAFRTNKKFDFSAQLIGLFLFLLLALGLSAAQLLPSLAFSRLSVRAHVDYAYVSGGFPLQDTWQLLLPGVLTHFSPHYVGVVGLGLALIGIADWRLGTWVIGYKPANHPITQSPNQQNHYSLFFGLLALVALLLAFGDNGFLYPLAYRFAPGWNLFRGQERAAFLVTLGLSVLIGLGMATLLRLPYPARRWLAVLYAAMVAVGTYGFGLFWQLLGRSTISQGQFLLIAGMTVLLALLFVVAVLLPGWGQRRSWLVVGLVVSNLFGANFTTNLDQFGPARKTILAPEMEALAAAVMAGDTDAIGLPGRVYNEFRIYEDHGMRQAIEDVWGSSPLRLAHYAALFDNFPLDRLWELTGVTHVLTWRRELFEPSELLAEFPQVTDTTYLHRLTEPNPRAWLVHALQPATDEAALALLADHAFNLTQVGLVPAEILADVTQLPGGTGAIQINQLAAGHLQVAVESTAGGLLIVSENWMPGWQVIKPVCIIPDAAQPTACTEMSPLVTGLQNLAVYRTDLTLLGILVPPGRVTFELLYWPDSVRLGLWISGSTLLLLVLLAAWHGTTRHRSTGP
ncbi:MAG: glycosyltransferase family 39 protein [Caldilineaceae bacterium]